MLNANQISTNWNIFRSKINELFPGRQDSLNKMYDYYEERMSILPASGVEYYHNAFAGGYVDHVLRVLEYSELEYDAWKRDGLKVDNFTLSELQFAAIHHDLGKVGLPGDYKQFQINPSKWHRENQGALFVHDSSHPFVLVPDASLFILQHFGITITFNEFLAIRTHDGVYDRANEAYYFSKGLDSKSRTNINQILHNSDMKAARFEFERWAELNPTKFKFYDPNGNNSPEPEQLTTKSNSSEIDFDKFFES